MVPAKKTITVTDVSISDGAMFDEVGNIADRVLEELPDDEAFFTVKIVIE